MHLSEFAGRRYFPTIPEVVLGAYAGAPWFEVARTFYFNTRTRIDVTQGSGMHRGGHRLWNGYLVEVGAHFSLNPPDC